MLIQSNSSNFIFNKIYHLEKICFIARLEAKVGKEEDCCIFKSALPLVRPDTVNWYGLQNGTIYLWNFLILLKLRKVKAHLEGKIAEALMANAEHYFLKIL
jgi:hypothetical protein